MSDTKTEDLTKKAEAVLAELEGKDTHLACIRLLGDESGSVIRQYGERGRVATSELRAMDVIDERHMQLTDLGTECARLLRKRLHESMARETLTERAREVIAELQAIRGLRGHDALLYLANGSIALDNELIRRGLTPRSATAAVTSAFAVLGKAGVTSGSDLFHECRRLLGGV